MAERKTIIIDYDEEGGVPLLTCYVIPYDSFIRPLKVGAVWISAVHEAPTCTDRRLVLWALNEVLAIVNED